MKKSFIFACVAAATMMFASCEKMDVINDGNVALNSVAIVNAMVEGEPITKADAKYATGTNLNSFQVGIYNGEKSVVEAAFNKPATTGKPWTDGNTYYWGEGTYKFYAAAQSTGTNAVAYGSANISKDGIKFTDRAVVANEDLIVAYATGSQTSKVSSLTFNHALARVRVAASFSADANVKIKAKFVKWELKNVSTKGSVTIDGSTITTSNVVWTPNATKADVSDSATPSVYLDSNYRIVDGTATTTNQENTNKYWVNVIPNATVYADELIATVDFYTPEDAKIATRKLHAKVGGTPALTYGTGFKYQSGKAYTYKITIKNDGGDPTSPAPGDDPNNLDSYKIEVTSISVTDWSGVDGGSAEFKK